MGNLNKLFNKYPLTFIGGILYYIWLIWILYLCFFSTNKPIGEAIPGIFAMGILLGLFLILMGIFQLKHRSFYLKAAFIVCLPALILIVSVLLSNLFSN